MGAARIAAIRAHIGTDQPPADEELEVAWHRLGSVEKVAHEVLSTRLADLLSRPAVFTSTGDYTEDWGPIITALEKRVAALAGAASGGGPVGSMTVHTLSRSDRHR